MQDLWVPYRRHAATLVVACVPLFVLSLVGASTGSEPLTWAPVSAAAPVLFGAGILWLIVLRWDRKLARLAGEPQHLLHWVYERPLWDRHVETLRRKARWLGPCLVGGFLLMGAVAALAITNDEQPPETPASRVWLLALGGGLVAGCYVWLLIAWNMKATHEQRLTRGGQVILGTTGFYLTGEFRPLDGFSQYLRTVRYESGDPARLVFTWRITGRYSTDQDVVVPIPPGRDEEARALVGRLTEDDE